MESESSAKPTGTRRQAGLPISSSKAATKGPAGKSSGKPRGSQGAAARSDLVWTLRNPGVDPHAGKLRVDSMATTRRSDPDRSSEEADEAKLETLGRWRGVVRVR
ncbi:MAG: hypothetical protein ACKV22_35660 [Bryobacteraceae bacterium]